QPSPGRAVTAQVTVRGCTVQRDLWVVLLHPFGNNPVANEIAGAPVPPPPCEAAPARAPVADEAARAGLRPPGASRPGARRRGRRRRARDGALVWPRRCG